jgi:ribosomal protein S18 acetylase RimI-like enzyme
MSSAPDLGIDLGLISAIVEENGVSPPRVLQACMPVVGAGRTAMIFVSGPGQRARFGSDDEQAADRAAALIAALRRARERHGDGVSLVQALAEPGETWASEAFRLAGLRQIAELLYLSRPLQSTDSDPAVDDTGLVRPLRGGVWPGGVRVRAMRPGGQDERALERALEVSYEGTLDCPELAGLRTLSDIVASHRAVGEFDRRLWWLVERSGSPEGCVLLNRCGQQRCVELVYVGLAPGLRGLGLGALLLEAGIAASAQLERELRCAVDVRNDPARRMYARHGFHEVGRRLAFIGLVEHLLATDKPTA